MVDPRFAPSPGFRITPQLIVGLLVIFVGVVFTLEELGIAPAINYLRYWPVAVSGIGVLKLLQARDGGGAFAGLLFAVAGAWLQAEELHLIHIRLRDVWPLGLVAFGGYLVWQGLTGRQMRVDAPASIPPDLPGDISAPRPSSGRVTDSNATMSVMAILGGVSRGNNSSAFRSADLLAIMGGCQIDLRRAAIN